MKILRKCNFKQMALGAIALTGLMVIPKIGDAISNAVATVRNKVAGRV